MDTPSCSKDHRPMPMLAKYTIKSHVPLFWECVWVEGGRYANLAAPECGNRIYNPEHPEYTLARLLDAQEAEQK